MAELAQRSGELWGLLGQIGNIGFSNRVFMFQHLIFCYFTWNDVQRMLVIELFYLEGSVGSATQMLIYWEQNLENAVLKTILLGRVSRTCQFGVSFQELVLSE